MRALAICDGEHYAPVVRDALAALPYEVVGLWLAGGGEKLRGGEDYGVPVVSSLEGGIAAPLPSKITRSGSRSAASAAPASTFDSPGEPTRPPPQRRQPMVTTPASAAVSR